MMMNLLPPDLRKADLFPWQRVFSAVLLISFLGLAAVYLYGYCEVIALETQIQKDRDAYQLLAPTIERQEAIEAMNAKLDKQYAILASISQERISGHSLLVHLGNMAIENVWLTQVKIKDQRELTMQGMATGYPYLAAFFRRVEQDSLLCNPLLISAGDASDSLGRDHWINFEITAQFKEF